ncbi:hypothetical protein [Paenibacillus taiwanensis]|uniref:hypothetical protein n=1 Tax=Paenibacillus taiwanensis TaxID=401638 RepID=UPI0003F793E6|nr:hypothetical protein [Paenibacillus taiwanensis]
MKLVRKFSLLVINLIGELWIGGIRRKPDFYDTHTDQVTHTKFGYYSFLAFITISVTMALYWFIYKN